MARLPSSAVAAFSVGLVILILPACNAGTVQLTLLRGKVLENTDTPGASLRWDAGETDTRVRVDRTEKVGDKTSFKVFDYKYDIVEDSLNPVWNKTINVYNVSDEESLTVQVEDRDKTKPNDILGRGELAAGANGTVRLELEKIVLYFHVTFIAFDPCTVNNGDCADGLVCIFIADNENNCNCPQGYFSETNQTDSFDDCQWINPCNEDNGGCGFNSTCNNTGPAKSTCTCQQGTLSPSNDGKNCKPIVGPCGVEVCPTTAVTSSAGPSTVGSSSGGLEDGALIGIIVGAAVFVMLAVLLTAMLVVRRKRRPQPDLHAMTETVETVNVSDLMHSYDHLKEPSPGFFAWLPGRRRSSRRSGRGKGPKLEDPSVPGQEVAVKGVIIAPDSYATLTKKEHKYEECDDSPDQEKSSASERDSVVYTAPKKNRNLLDTSMTSQIGQTVVFSVSPTYKRWSQENDQPASRTLETRVDDHLQPSPDKAAVGAPTADEEPPSPVYAEPDEGKRFDASTEGHAAAPRSVYAEATDGLVYADAEQNAAMLYGKNSAQRPDGQRQQRKQKDAKQAIQQRRYVNLMPEDTARLLVPQTGSTAKSPSEYDDAARDDSAGSASASEYSSLPAVEETGRGVSGTAHTYDEPYESLT